MAKVTKNSDNDTATLQSQTIVQDPPPHPLDNHEKKPVVVAMTLKDSSGADVPVYLSASFPDFTHAEKMYRALMTPDALSPIAIGIQGVGGLSEEGTTAIAIVNAFETGPLYDPDTHTYIGQPIEISRILPNNSIIQLYQGYIRRFFETPKKLSIDVSPQTSDRLRVLPHNDFFTLQSFPFIPKELIGLPVPILFGSWNTLNPNLGIDPTEHYIAKVTITNFQNNEGIVARNITPNSGDNLFFIPREKLIIHSLDGSQTGDTFTYSIPTTTTIMQNTQSIGTLDFASESGRIRFFSPVSVSIDAGVDDEDEDGIATADATISDGSITAITVTHGGSGYDGSENVSIYGGGGTGATAYIASTSGGEITSITVSDGGSNYGENVEDWDLVPTTLREETGKDWILSPTETVTGTPDLNANLSIAMQNNTGGNLNFPTPTEIAVFVALYYDDDLIWRKRYHWERFEAIPLSSGDTNTRSVVFSSTINSQSSDEYNNAIPSDFSPTSDELDLQVLLVTDGIFNRTWTLSGSILLRQTTSTSQTEDDFSDEEIANQTFLLATGYKDDRTRYKDGNEISQANRVLKMPPDVIQALYRDKEIGNDLSISEIDLPAFCAIRANMDKELDFQLFSEMTRADFSDLAEQSNIHIINNLEGKLSAIDHPSWRTDPVFILEDKDILINQATGAPAIAIETTPQEELANEFFLRYGYNTITNEYEKFIIKTHVHTAQGTGSLNHTTKVLTDPNQNFTALPISVGDMICMPEIYLAARITAITQNSLTLAASAVSASQNNLKYFIGPHFNYDCYLSALQNFSKDTGETRDREQSDRNTETVVFKSGKIESKYIRDKRTANAYLQSLIERFSLQLFYARIDTTAIVEQLKRGDIITVNSSHITATHRARKWMVEHVENVPVRETCQIRLVERRRAKDPFYAPPEILIDNPQFTSADGWTLPTEGSLITLEGDGDFAKTAAQLSGNVATFPSLLSDNIDISSHRTYILNIDAQKTEGDRQFRVQAIFKSATATISTVNLLQAQTPDHIRWQNFRILFGSGQDVAIPADTTRVQLSIAAPGIGTNQTTYRFSNLQLLERN